MARTVDFTEKYTIKSNGDVYSLVSKTTLKPVVLINGYTSVTLCNNGRKKQFLLHRLVAEKYISNPYKKPCVNHIDGNKSNNNVSNLEWCTYKENINHAYENGLMVAKKGKDSHMYGTKMKNETKEKIKKSILESSNPYNIKSYSFKKNGRKVLIKNMSLFCKENDLTESCMFRVIRGERKTHKGYSL